MHLKMKVWSAISSVTIANILNLELAFLEGANERVKG
jgi:hypothetical protein